MLFTESSCVCIPSFKYVTPLFSLAKVSFLALFFFNIEGGVAIYSKYIYICGFVGQLRESQIHRQADHSYFIIYMNESFFAM